MILCTLIHRGIQIHHWYSLVVLQINESTTHFGRKDIEREKNEREEKRERVMGKV